MKTKLIKPLIFFTWLLVIFLPHSIEAAEPVEAPESTFTALDGTEVSANGRGYQATVLIFGNTTCDFTSNELSEIAASAWVKDPDIRVIFAEYGRRSKETVEEFANRYCGSDIITCYDDKSGAVFEAMVNYVKAYQETNSFSTVVTVLIDGQNQIQNVYKDGAVPAKDILEGMNAFTNTGYPKPSSYDNVFADLVISGTEDYASAKQVFQLVNQARSENGISSLYLDKELTETAMRRAAEIAIYYSHTRPDGSECFSIFPNQMVIGAENIAVGYSNSEKVIQGWLDSTGHRANILHAQMKNIGIGCFVDNRSCRYWVQCFDGDAGHTELIAENLGVSRTIRTKASNITLNAEPKKCIYSCGSTGRSGQMRIWNVNSGVYGGKPSLGISLFEYKSDNPSVATVDEYGGIILHGAGTAVITATLKGEAPISVSQTIEKQEHQVVITDTKHYCSVCETVIWEKEESGSITKPDEDSSNPSSPSNAGSNATKPGNGTSKLGSVSKPASGKPSQGSVSAQKQAKVKSIKLSAPKKTLKAGKTMKLKATVKTTGGGHANTKLKWKSSKKKYAAVNQKGKVTAKKAGAGKTVTITASSTDGTKKKAKIKIKIK